MLYLGRVILVPVTLAFVLGIALSPLVRALRRCGLGNAFSVLGAVACVATAFGVLAFLIAMQAERVAASLPTYRATFVRGAREFLKGRSFAAYCDSVLVPALQLALVDFDTGAITVQQQTQVRTAIVRVVEDLDDASRGRMSTRPTTTVLDQASAGGLLRETRLRGQRLHATRQAARTDAGGAAAPLVLRIALGAIGDDLATELLVRMLCGMGVDARHLTLDDLHAPRKPDTPVPAISVVCLVSMTAGPWRDEGARLAPRVRASLPQAELMALLLPGMSGAQAVSPLAEVVELAVGSFEDATLEFQPGRVRGSDKSRT
jgi:hypothetical protein